MGYMQIPEFTDINQLIKITNSNKQTLEYYLCNKTCIDNKEYLVMSIGLYNIFIDMNLLDLISIISLTRWI